MEVEVRGRFMWHQLLTRDVPGARKFYAGITGWQVQTWPLDPSYTICLSGDLPTAGMMAFTAEVPAEAPSHWLQYIGTRDVDGTADMAVRLGGSIIKQPSEMRGAGRYAVLRDPQGAVFAIIDPKNARPEMKGDPVPGQFCWHELATTDHEAAFAFYSNLFGWDALTRLDMGPVGVYLIFGQDGDQKGGIYLKPAAASASHWLPYLNVPDVDAAAPAVEAAGGKVMQPPMDVPGGSRITMILDPAGCAFALHSLPRARAASADPPSPAAARMSKASKKRKAKKGKKASAKPKARVPVKAKARAAVRKKTRGTSRIKAKAKAKAKTKAKTKARARPNKTARRKK